ncbi:VOC family protein [Flavivirga spongiicola]|uniref:VOC family protein n=1 Tax=Flavivirga spongiicola TaxID=421621 RepID=A0ABU7XX37_9FLAO|nr:VOC family protein [Flavivirga sp. MEBiC05379]MDO5980346.1 VOC family protein [Flavivirga sp. MEBiC05379]
MLSNSFKITAILCACLLVACGESEPQNKSKSGYEKSFESGATEGFCELVNYGVKELGLGVPMTPEKMDTFFPQAEIIAKKHNVLLYREPDLIDTDLFTRGIAKGRDVPLIYNGATLTKYFDLKADRKRLEENGLYKGKAREEIARRFGRLLSYTPRTINNQLAMHTDFRTMYDFDIKESNLLFYYKDLTKATQFYTNTLGLELVADHKTSKVVRIANDSFLTLVDASEGGAYSNKPKTVALAFVTDQVEAWFHYLKKKDIQIKHTYKPVDGKPYHSFVMSDPEGYLLEFEKFNQHPQNEDLIPILKNNKISHPNTNMGKKLSINSSITWLYYKNVLEMQYFYQDVLGLELVCDQGWVKIYQSSKTGFIGLVDEKRGMHKFAEDKAVNVSFVLEDIEKWYEYVKSNKTFKIESLDMDDKKLFKGIDPEGYHMLFMAK